MSSLRPLLTILLLAAVGVVLYMKINETEPVIPAGVGEWTAGPLDLGGGASAGDAGATTSPPAYATDAPPAFVPGAPVGGASTPSAGDEAPSWSPGPAVSSEPAKMAIDTPAVNAESSPVARSADPDTALPAMPAIPEASVIADVAPAFAPATVPGLDTNTTAAIPVEPITPTGSTPDAASLDTTSSTPAKTSLYPSVRVAVQAELERGELGQALLRLSDWYGDPSLTPEESKEVEMLLSQLAGSVIWEGPPAHRLEPAHVVQAGETLQDVAGKYDVPWELLAKINGVTDPAALQPGQELKVLRGKFSALVDLSERTMTLMLDRRYAGKFAIELDPTTAIEEGQWKVDQKALTPAGGGVYGQANGATEDRSLLLSNPASPNSQATVLRGPGSDDPASPQPAGRVIRLKSNDVNDVFDILSVGSRVTIRR